MLVIKSTVKSFFKTSWAKWVVIFLFLISIMSLGTYRDIVDLFTALLSSYSDNFFIAIIFLILSINTLYIYKSFFNSNNYIVRNGNYFNYLKNSTLSTIIISFIYYLILLIFVIFLTLFRIKGGIDFSIAFNYGISNWLYFLYHYFKVFIILMIIINISKYILLLFKRSISIIFYFMIFLFIIEYSIPIYYDPNHIYEFNVLFPYYFYLLDFGSLKVDITYLFGELSILYGFNIIFKNYYLHVKKSYFNLPNLKFLKLELRNFLKDNFKYFLIFFIIEAFMILTYSFLTPNNNVMYFALNLIRARNDTFIILNKLFSILFIIFVSLLNIRYIYGYGKAYLALRSSNTKIIYMVVISLLCNLFFINLCLAILGIGISLIRGLNISFNFNTLVNILFLEINISLLINFMIYNKYRLFSLAIFILIIFFILSFKLQIINILLFVIILLLSIKLLKIQDIE